MGHAGFAKKGSDRDKGIIHVLVVRQEMRRKGIGSQLLNYCESFLSTASTVTIGAMGEDIFYSHSESSLLPLWGSSEGIGLEAKDYETRRFLERRGYRQLDNTVSMVADLSAISEPVADTSNVVPVSSRWIMANPDVPLEDPANDFLRPPAPCESLVYLQKGAVVGTIVTYSMSELEQGRAAIIDFWVHQPYRGKGIGNILLDATLNHLSKKGFNKVELVTDPLKNSVAYAMYKKRGFRIVTEWCSYQKERRRTNSA
jgi:ribosomal protein S18 acetylase RimI-like enzyme